MKSSKGRHGGSHGLDKHEAEQAKAGGGMADSLSGTRDKDEAEGHTSGKD